MSLFFQCIRKLAEEKGPQHDWKWLSIRTQNIRRLIGFFRPYRSSCSALVAYGSLILDKVQNWEFLTTWMNMNYWSQKATAGSPERVAKNNIWIIFFDNQPLKPHPYCIKTTTFLCVHMNPLLVINYTVSLKNLDVIAVI